MGFCGPVFVQLLFCLLPGDDSCPSWVMTMFGIAPLQGQQVGAGSRVSASVLPAASGD